MRDICPGVLLSHSGVILDSAMDFEVCLLSLVCGKSRGLCSLPVVSSGRWYLTTPWSMAPLRVLDCKPQDSLWLTQQKRNLLQEKGQEPRRLAARTLPSYHGDSPAAPACQPNHASSWLPALQIISKCGPAPLSPSLRIKTPGSLVCLSAQGPPSCLPRAK